MLIINSAWIGLSWVQLNKSEITRSSDLIRAITKMISKQSCNQSTVFRKIEYIWFCDYACENKYKHIWLHMNYSAEPFIWVYACEYLNTPTFANILIVHSRYGQCVIAATHFTYGEHAEHKQYYLINDSRSCIQLYIDGGYGVIDSCYCARFDDRLPSSAHTEQVNGASNVGALSLKNICNNKFWSTLDDT